MQGCEVLNVYPREFKASMPVPGFKRSPSLMLKVGAVGAEAALKTFDAGGWEQVSHKRAHTLTHVTVAGFSCIGKTSRPAT